MRMASTPGSRAEARRSRTWRSISHREGVEGQEARHVERNDELPGVRLACRDAAELAHVAAQGGAIEHAGEQPGGIERAARLPVVPKVLRGLAHSDGVGLFQPGPMPTLSSLS
jgi:hypothetical protein